MQPFQFGRKSAIHAAQCAPRSTARPLRRLAPLRLHSSQPSATHDSLSAAAPKPAASAPTAPHQPPVPPAPPRAPARRKIPQWLSTALLPITVPGRAYGRAQHKHPLRTQLITTIVIYLLGDLSTQFVMSPCSPIAPPDTVAPPRSVLETSPILHRPDDLAAPAEPRGRFAQFLDEHYSGARSLRAMVIGGLSSIPGYKWFLFLGTHFNVPAGYLPPRATFFASLALKVAVNQAVFTPLFNSYFFGMQSLLAFPFLPFPSLSLSTLGALSADERTLALRRFCSTDNLWAAWERIRDTVPSSWVNSCKFWPAVTAFSFTFIPVQHRNIFSGVVAIGWQTYLGVLNQQAATREGLLRP